MGPKHEMLPRVCVLGSGGSSGCSRRLLGVMSRAEDSKSLVVLDLGRPPARRGWRECGGETGLPGRLNGFVDQSRMCSCC